MLDLLAVIVPLLLVFGMAILLGRWLLTPAEEREAAAYERAFRDQRRQLNASIAARRVR